MLRMMVYLSACLAASGSSSPIAMPLTLVGRVRRKGPVKSSPAFGLGSQVSVCVGPPAIQSWITDFALGAALLRIFRSGQDPELGRFREERLPHHSLPRAG